MISNDVEMFCKCISQLDVVNKCVLCIWDAFTDNMLRIFRKKHFSHFLVQKIQDAQLLQRDRVAGCIIVLAKSGRLELGHNILRTL